MKLQVVIAAEKILVRCPWVVENLCPHDLVIQTFESKVAEIPTGLAATIRAGESEEQYSVDGLQDSVFYIAVSLQAYTSCSHARIVLGKSGSDKIVELQDGAGRRLDLRLKIYADVNGDLVVCLYPQMVIINRSGVLLKYGRGTSCDDIDEVAGAGDMESGVEGGRPATKGKDAVIDESEESKSNAFKEWFKDPPQVHVFSLPEGPSWSPWLRTPSGSKWTRISFAELMQSEMSGEGSDEGRGWSLGGNTLKLVSNVQVHACNI